MKLIQALYKLIRPKSKFPKTFNFYKEDDRWYIDLPKYPGPKAALQMVAGADDLCELLSPDGEVVSIQCSPEYFRGASHQLSLFRKDSGGTYTVRSLLTSQQLYKETVWLCPVVVYVFGEIPQYIYFRAA